MSSIKADKKQEEGCEQTSIRGKGRMGASTPLVGDLKDKELFPLSSHLRSFLSGKRGDMMRKTAREKPRSLGNHNI